MTAVNIVRRPGEILVMTDGLSNNSSSHFLRGKIALIPDMPLLVAVRGLAATSQMMVARLLALEARDFDGALALVPGIAKEIVPAICGHFKVDMPHEIHIVGFSKSRARLENHFLASSDAYVDLGREPYGLYLGDDEMTGSPQPSEEAIRDAGLLPVEPEDFDPMDHGIKLMEAQRQTYPQAVGGFMQLSRVTVDGISSHVVHRWPNQVQSSRGPKK